MQCRAASCDGEQVEDKEDNKTEIRPAVEHISPVFQDPVQAKYACLASLNDEVDQTVDFGRKQLDVLENYNKAWYTGCI